MSLKALIEDLKRSGLTRAVVKTLKLKPLTAKQTAALGHFEVPSYQIPYYDIRGKLIKSYYRVRYLETPKGKFGATLDKPPRYSGPTGEAPRAYFSPVLDWSNPVVDDVSIPIWITEGEKKATAACLAGAYCIGLGGVAMFQSRKRGIDFLPELDAFNWSERPVVIAFDSDKDTNVNIMRELSTLSQRLLDRNARVWICDIPETVEGEKAGLDDFLVQFTTKKKREAALAWLGEDCTYEYSLSAALFELQQECAVIRRYSAVWLSENHALVNNYSQLKTVLFGNRFYTEPATTEDGKPKIRNAFEAWLEWAARREYSDITYDPGAPEVTDDCLNVWRGWGVEPERGDIKPFVELVDFLFTSEPALKPWFWQWLAYPLQNPGAKLYSAVVLHGPMQGTGKTFLGEIIGDIYGENFSLLSQDDLVDKFNDAFARKQFCLADEVIGAQDRRQADKLKGFITRQTLAINRKFEAPYVLRDTVNYLFTSNHFDAVYLERSDRRYAVCQVPDTTQPPEFYRRVREWREAGGAAHLFEHLRKVDVSEFDPKARPPETESHTEMVYSSFSDVDQWCEDLKNAPDSILGDDNERVLFQPTELLTLYDPGGRKGTSGRALGQGLKKAGFYQKSVGSKRWGGVRRLYAVRNPEDWRRKSGAEWAKEYERHDITNRREKFT